MWNHFWEPKATDSSIFIERISTSHGRQYINSIYQGQGQSGIGIHSWNPVFSHLHHINQAWYCTPIILENQEVEAGNVNMVSSRPVRKLNIFRFVF